MTCEVTVAISLILFRLQRQINKNQLKKILANMEIIPFQIKFIEYIKNNLNGIQKQNTGKKFRRKMWLLERSSPVYIIKRNSFINYSVVSLIDHKQ